MELDSIKSKAVMAQLSLIHIYKIVRKYNPKTLLNPRSGYEGDFYCDEGSHEITGKILPVPWEKNMCVCSGCSWGWICLLYTSGGK